MSYIKINQDKVTPEVVQELQKICPFNAFDYTDQYLSINAACKICKICANKGPKGICEFVDEPTVKIDKSLYKGITVYIEHFANQAHPVSWELIGKAIELSKISHEEVTALIISNQPDQMIDEALSYGVDKVVVYQSTTVEQFNVLWYTSFIEQYVEDYSPNAILFGGTMQGRSFAPRVAARLRTGLTADCTKLEMNENGDLMQIRPAFGGNIMAKIHTPNHRPQLATIRYKMFHKPKKVTPHGTSICHITENHTVYTDYITLQDRIPKTDVEDISEAEIIIAVGRAFKKKKDLDLIKPLKDKLQATIACTRPLVENGWFDARKQIGLSGRTVKPKLLINIGISGAVQFIEGMKDSELIITINNDPDTKLFDVSHYGIVGDLYEILPEINASLDTFLQTINN